VVRSEARDEAPVCSEAGEETMVSSGLGLRTAGGGGTAVSRATEERERALGQKIAKCDKR
jgi:hypothetical protein